MTNTACVTRMNVNTQCRMPVVGWWPDGDTNTELEWAKILKTFFKI